MPPISAWKKCLNNRGQASLDGNNLLLFYYLSTCEIWPYKTGGIWWEWPYKGGTHVPVLSIKHLFLSSNCSKFYLKIQLKDIHLRQRKKDCLPCVVSWELEIDKSCNIYTETKNYQTELLLFMAALNWPLRKQHKQPLTFHGVFDCP